jgi:hypothetical protein
MLFMKFLLLLLLSTAIYGQSVPERVKKFEKPKDYAVEYDKFKQRHVVTFHNYWKTKRGAVRFTAMAVVPDKGDVIFYWHFKPITPVVMNQERLRILADGELIESHRSDIGMDATFFINHDQMKKIVNAKTVEMQLWAFESKIGDSTIKKLRHLYSLKD